jgi:hypothetical protein
MMRLSLKLYDVIPSPLSGGPGWGSLRILGVLKKMLMKDLPTPTPTLPTRGRGKTDDQPTEKLIRAALKELATG